MSIHPGTTMAVEEREEHDYTHIDRMLALQEQQERAKLNRLQAQTRALQARALALVLIGAGVLAFLLLAGLRLWEQPLPGLVAGPRPGPVAATASAPEPTRTTTPEPTAAATAGGAPTPELARAIAEAERDLPAGGKVILDYTLFTEIPFPEGAADGFGSVVVGRKFASSTASVPEYQFCYVVKADSVPALGRRVTLARKEGEHLHVTPLDATIAAELGTTVAVLEAAQRLCRFS